MERELFKELYLFELKRKEELTGRVTVLLTAVTVVGALLGYLLKSYPLIKPIDLSSFSFGLLLALTIFFYGRSIYYLTRLYSGYIYQVIPTPASLQSYYQELVAFYSNHPDEEGDADSQFRIYLDARYAGATEANASNNEAKASYHARSLQTLVFTLIFMTIAAAFHWVKGILP